MPVESTTYSYGKDATPAPKQSAALTGAARAFGNSNSSNNGPKPPIKPKPIINSYSGNHGALAAAKRASPSRKPLPRPDHPGHSAGAGDQRLIYHKSGSSIGSENDWEHSAFLQRRMGTGGHLQPPPASSSLRDPSKSPSFIAAALAASRSVPASPNHTGQQQQQLSPAALQKLAGSTTRSSPSVRSGSSKASSDLVLDTTPIPPTTSLIGMFERNGGPQPAPKKVPTRAPRKPSPERKVLSPSPTIPTSPMQATPVRKSGSRVNLSKHVSPQSRIETSRANDSPSRGPVPRPDSAPNVRSKPIPIPPKPKAKPEISKVEDQQASSNDSFVSASDYQPSIHALYGQRSRTQSVASPPQNRNIDALANAIVASSLASSRAVSPSRSFNSSHPPPPPPARRHLFHNSKEDARTPSPAKSGLRTTMRKPPKPDEEDEAEKRRGRKHIMKKHPNKHHEGDRKRWRDEITPRERKRYEAVWASNRGLFPSSVASASEVSVCNLIVKDIFSRSRLHPDELEEVYSLVDRGESGRLIKEEFVVGLWLIDQRLKGRKLPIRVSDSVWRSASGVLGAIKVRKAK
ncbi:Increased rDNA silencing protein 4 [Phlyctema vagabunda]|uniref:Increased rDNA silencing protein 4 n=1 Tax=Phlyctema vagabunda TaxID=108571 RepID=A0ABR4P340_9HELO